MKKKFYYLCIPVILCIVLSMNQAHGQVWETHIPGFGDTIHIWDIEVVNENVIWAVGNKMSVTDTIYPSPTTNETYYAVSKDGGNSWKTGTIPIGPKPFIANLAAIDASTAMVMGLENYANAKTLKTSDGGTTWQTTPVGWDPVASWPDYIHAFSVAKWCIIGDPRNGDFEIYGSGNAGAVWVQVPGTNIPDPLSGEFSFDNCGTAIGNTIWFGTNKGRIYRSKDSGNSWEVFDTPLDGTGFFYLSFSDENHGLITTGFGAGINAKMYTTNDGGATWTELTNLPHNGAFFTFGPAAYIPGQPYIIQGLTAGGYLTGPYETWLSSDRGITWKQISTGEIIGWPTFLNGTVGWAGEFQQLKHPTRLYKYIGSPLTGLFSPNKLEADIKISPNPASDILQVNVIANESGNFWILLNDQSGKLIQKLEVPNSKTFSRELEIKNLPAGIYFLTVTGDKGSESQKLVITH